LIRNIGQVADLIAIALLDSCIGMVDSGKLPRERGVKLHRDDIILLTIIMELMCQFQLSLDKIEEKYHLNFEDDFAKYFSPEQSQLHRLEADALVKVSGNAIEVTPTGRLLIRNIASIFDRYLGDRTFTGFSQAI
jgi:oxygen-independent coproporphyrinogen-3 oxidase